MEALRRATLEGRTDAEGASAWLTVLDSYNIKASPLNPCASSATWLLAEQLNISAYDAGYVTIAKARGLPLFSQDEALVRRAAKIGVRGNAGNR